MKYFLKYNHLSSKRINYAFAHPKAFGQEAIYSLNKNLELGHHDEPIIKERN